MIKVHILCNEENENIPEDLIDTIGETTYRPGYVNQAYIQAVYEADGGTFVEMANGSIYIVRETINEII